MQARLNLLGEALTKLNAGQAVVLASVVETWGSSPRPVGSEMFVTRAGEMQGSVSGGCIEASVVAEALAILESGAILETGTPRILSFGVSDDQAWDVGLSCGGQIKVYLERLDPEDRDLLGQLRDIVDGQAARRAMAWVRDLDTGERFLYRAGDEAPLVGDALRAGSSRLVEQADGGRLFVRVFAPVTRLIIIGAVHVAQHLVELAERSGFDVTIVDPRRAWASQDRFGTARLCHDWPDEAIRHLEPDRHTAVAALCHDPKIDDPGLAAALASNAFYIGALGSRRTHAKRLERLAKEGLSTEDLARIHAPIGLDIGARTPDEIALAILAQVVQEKNLMERPT